MKIVILSASVREGRDSHRVALFFNTYIQKTNLAQVDLLDLKAYNFPIFEERLKFQKNPDSKTLEFAEKIKSANGIIIVSPEYNGGYPASLKNVIDLISEGWKGKPIAISTVSSGAFAGMNLITSLQFVFWKLQALTVPAQFPVPKVSENFDESGNPIEANITEARASKFLNELLFYMQVMAEKKP